jgi:cobaltochelatase CobN
VSLFDVRRVYAGIRLLFLLCLLFTSLGIHSAHAERLLVLVSSRNIPEVVAGAHQSIEQNPDLTIQVRSVDQWQQLNSSAQARLLQNTDTVLMAGVFGDPVPSLVSLLEYQKTASVIVLHSDHRLMRLSRDSEGLTLRDAPLEALMSDPKEGESLEQWMRLLLNQYPEYRRWLLARFYWLGRTSSAMKGLFDLLSQPTDGHETWVLPTLSDSLRISVDGVTTSFSEWEVERYARWTVLLDYETGDRLGEAAVNDALCQTIKDKAGSDMGCLVVFARWGEATLEAMHYLEVHKDKLASLVSLQSFVLGGSEGREAATEYLKRLNVPVINALNLTDQTEMEWRLSESGIPADAVHYKMAMPEIQGLSQSTVVSALDGRTIDPLTGAELSILTPIKTQVEHLANRISRWARLQRLPNAQKKVAIIYYNHPPGRHNIGADNLNVPASIWAILNTLKQQGYHVGDIPESEEALLDLLQQRGINLPEDGSALQQQARHGITVSADQYLLWFKTLPKSLQQEMQLGPLGFLDAQVRLAIQNGQLSQVKSLTDRALGDLIHAVEGASHPAKGSVIRWLDALRALYQSPTLDESALLQAASLIQQITDQGIEGIRGWGPAPGRVMVSGGQLVIPGLVFGNVFIGPQPPRGWELNEELLHANLSFPPTHQYLAFYRYISQTFKADALIHLGRHSTYEFLPRHRVGMSEEDYPAQIAGDLPGIYPYIVDGVGEGIQAKRRGIAVIVDHLTPPLAATELYDQLLGLRQLVESYEAAPESAIAMRQRAVTQIKQQVEALNMAEALEANMQAELDTRGVEHFDQVDDTLLVHEVGHYLTQLQESFMPLGLHKFGVEWSEEAVQTLWRSMQQNDTLDETLLIALRASPSQEMNSLLRGLKGQFIEPGNGNDPIRTPSVLPTGRNFYALDGSLIPSRLGYAVGKSLAEQLDDQPLKPTERASESVVLWASDVVRDEGAMIGFGLARMGIEPIWNSRGIVKGLKRIPLEHGKKRHDILFTTSGLFRDLYGAQIEWLDQAVLIALDGASLTIRSQYPELTPALNTALAPLGVLQNNGQESLDDNELARQWVNDLLAAKARGEDLNQAGTEATYRLFGVPPGAYGAGVNRLVERSGAWNDRKEVADVYLLRMGHAYGRDRSGTPAQGVFKQRLSRVGVTYLGRASHLYGLIDNNDAFDYLGGLNMAVEMTAGAPPKGFVLSHSDSDRLDVKPLEAALYGELKGRFLNPQWIKPLMQQGYSGARTMGSEFLEYLWGWQVTSPELIQSWVWDDVKSVYLDDQYQLGMDAFLRDGHNVHVRTNMIALMLVAAQKGFWKTDQATLQQLSEEFVALVAEHGFPGSGHTQVDHPVMEWMKTYLTEEQQSVLDQLRDRTRVELFDDNAIH